MRRTGQRGLSLTLDRQLAGHVAAHHLRRAGVPWVTGVAGESFLPLLDGLRIEGIPFISTVHEAGAVFLASAHARMTGRAAVAAVTRGPGASNAMIGIHEAAQASAPVVLIIGQVESAIRGRRSLQEMEFDRVFGSVAKAVFEVTRGDQLAPSLLAAIRKAEVGRPGPVVVSVPADHFYDALAVGKDQPAVFRTQVVPAALSPDGLEELSRLVDGAARGLIVLGRAFSGGAHAGMLERFAETTGFGVIGGHAHPDVMRTDHPQWLGCSTIRGPRALKRALQESDVILLFDHWLGDRVTQGYVPLSATVAVVTSEIDVGWDEYLGAKFFLAAPGEALARLASVARTSAGGEARRAWVADHRRELASDAEATLLASASSVPHGAVPFSAILEAVDRLLPEESTLVADAGSFNDWFIRYLPYRRGRRYLGPLSGSMGFAVPAAIGAQLARPESRTVGLTGDGGFLMTGMEVATAASRGLPLTIIVFRNEIWGSIALHQDAAFNGRRFAVELPKVSYAGLARALGANAHTVRSVGDLEVLREAFASPTPTIVEIVTDGVKPSPASFESPAVSGSSRVGTE